MALATHISHQECPVWGCWGSVGLSGEQQSRVPLPCPTPGPARRVCHLRSGALRGHGSPPAGRGRVSPGRRPLVGLRAGPLRCRPEQSALKWPRSWPAPQLGAAPAAPVPGRRPSALPGNGPHGTRWALFVKSSPGRPDEGHSRRIRLRGPRPRSVGLAPETTFMIGYLLRTWGVTARAPAKVPLEEMGWAGQDPTP